MEEAAAETTGTSPSLSPDGRPAGGAAVPSAGDLFREHGRMVFGLCRLLLRDPVEAEDATQQVFLAAHRSVITGVSPREPAAWLAAIARNECRARIRSRTRTQSELPLLPDHLPDPVASAVRTADLDALWRALAELPRRQRKAFLLRELGGLSYRELGIALGVTRPAVESLLFRARKHLRDLLTAANVAAAPALLRDQLTRLLPTFCPSSSVPTAAKCAAVAVGFGLGAAGVAELPEHHRPPAPAHHLQSAVVDVKPTARPRQEPRAAAPPRPVSRQPTASESRAARHRRSRGEGVSQQAEPAQERELPQPQGADRQGPSGGSPQPAPVSSDDPGEAQEPQEEVAPPVAASQQSSGDGMNQGEGGDGSSGEGVDGHGEGRSGER